MKGPILWLLGGAGVALLAYAEASLFLDNLCDIERRTSTPSPGGKNVAIVFGVDCGATTSLNTQLSVQPPDVSFDRDKYPAVLALKDKWPLDVRWIDSDALSVVVPQGAYEYKRVANSGEIAISYGK